MIVLILKIFVNMKYFRVTYVPSLGQDKRWIMWRAASIEELRKFFKLGDLIDIKEVTEEEYERHLE